MGSSLQLDCTQRVILNKVPESSSQKMFFQDFVSLKFPKTIYVLTLFSMKNYPLWIVDRLVHTVHKVVGTNLSLRRHRAVHSSIYLQKESLEQ